MLYQIEVAGIHTENEDGTERKNIVRRHLDPEAGKKYQPILQRERDNHHDENAIAVHIVSTGLIGANSYKIGYLDREMAKQVAHFLDSGGKIKTLLLSAYGFLITRTPYLHFLLATTARL